ncbi:MAG: hypothetical protein JSR56_05905 [Proteobacteria bacterium]|nr:hypothetical protein [Pseudomonadota bacterium]
MAAIGGYFALERDSGAGLGWIDDAVRYQSARSAIAAVLNTARPAKVWAPNFICGAVNDTLRAFGAPVKRYTLSETLGIPGHVEPAATDLLVCVDYFGIHANAVAEAIGRFGAGRMLIDASQSMYLRAPTGASTVYSPRKFFGVPDGGMLRTALSVPHPYAPNEVDSLTRSRHLLARRMGLVDAGYALFQEAEASLSGCPPVAMSQFTTALLRSVDCETAAIRRTRNYRHLATRLRAQGFEVPFLPRDAVPLCCPVRCKDAARVRRELATRCLFTPIYWPDADIPDSDRVGLRLRDHTVYLPCDQRYGESDMSYIANVLIESVEAS